MSQPVYALNLFNVSNKAEYTAYVGRAGKEVQARGGRIVAMGKFRAAAAGEIAPRAVMVLVEWTSKDAFDGYCNDPALADLHPHRVNGTSDYIWHVFDRIDDFKSILK